MFDTRPLEHVSSVIFLTVFPMVALLPAAMAGGFTFLAVESWIAAIGTGLCGLFAGMVGALALLWFMKWTRTGQAPGFLAEVADLLGGGDVSVASLLFSMLSPRISGTVDGHDYRLTLRRQAGFLSPSRVGGRFAIFGWMFDLHMEASVGVKVGFGPEEMSEMGLGLLGLSGKAEVLDGLKMWSNGTPEGEQIVATPEVQQAARSAVSFGYPGGSIIRVGPESIDVSGYLSSDLTPEIVAAFITDLARLASAVPR